jgi:hypothetical protein
MDPYLGKHRQKQPESRLKGQEMRKMWMNYNWTISHCHHQTTRIAAKQRTPANLSLHWMAMMASPSLVPQNRAHRTTLTRVLSS